MVRRHSALETLRPELDFLKRIASAEVAAKYVPTWLSEDEYEGPVWDVKLDGKIALRLNFGIELYDGSNLTADRHIHLLTTMKGWLGVQDKVSPLTGVTLGTKAILHRIAAVTQLCDYFLLNGRRLRIAEHGLFGICDADIYQLISDLASSYSIADSVYRWKENLSDFLINAGKTISSQQILEVASRYPAILEVTIPKEDWELNLSRDQLICSRVWLMANNLYSTRARDSFEQVPLVERLTAMALPPTIARRRFTEIPWELCFGAHDRFRREREGVPVKTGLQDDALRTTQSTHDQRRYLARLKELAEISGNDAVGLAAAITSATDNREFLKQLKLRTEGRYCTFPKSVIFPMFRGALEFLELYGDVLVDAFLAIARAKASPILAQVPLAEIDVQEYIGPELKSLGVLRWSIVPFGISEEQVPDKAYFADLRANVGLFELLLVCIGATTVAMGLLTARRIGELTDLLAGQALIGAGDWLDFANRKSGPLGYRETLTRPIPKVISRAVRRLERLQEGLIESGHIDGFTNLLSVPRRGACWLRKVKGDTVYRCIDLFCDYVQAELDCDGRRYYYRQHVGRRFFVLLFFWGANPGGMDTLRWYLGHTDVEHLWHYLSESTPGAVMRQSMAQFAAEEARRGSSSASALRSILEAHFGIDRFSVMLEDEVAPYVESLIKDGLVQVEPVFFECNSGRSYEVLIKVRPMDESR